MVHFKEFKNKLEHEADDSERIDAVNQNQGSMFHLKSKKKKYFLIENESKSRQVEGE